MALYGGLKSDNIAFIIMKSICFRNKDLKKKRKLQFFFFLDAFLCFSG